jgi:multiple antibiotic resistance protein
MEGFVGQIAVVFMGFFAIMNPLANTPIFISLTSDDDQATKRAVARNAVVLTFVIIVVFCVAGRLIFDMFGITLPAFKITGGLLVFQIGFHMLQGDQSNVHKPSDKDQETSREAKLSVAVSPLTMPILAGPGTIATAMNYSVEGGLYNVSITVVAFFLLCIITYAFFVFGDRLVHYVGSSAINAMTRMMGLILAVIGTQMVIDGIQALSKTVS